MRRILIIIAIFSVTILSFSKQCDRKVALQMYKTVKVLDLSGKVINYLDESGAELAFVARKRAEKNHGIDYTHIGIAWKQDGKWTVTNLLEECIDPKKAALYDDGVAIFYGSAKVYDALILIPSEKTQREFKEVVVNKEIDKIFDEKYSINTNVWKDEYQNCVQFVLEAYGYYKSGEKYTTRKEVISWLKDNDFQPEKVKVNWFERTLGPLILPNINMDDHKDREKSNIIEVASPRKVVEFIKKVEPESTIYEIKDESSTK